MARKSSSRSNISSGLRGSDYGIADFQNIWAWSLLFIFLLCVSSKWGGEVTSQPFHPLGSALVSIQLATIKKKKLSKVTLNCWNIKPFETFKSRLIALMSFNRKDVFVHSPVLKEFSSYLFSNVFMCERVEYLFSGLPLYIHWKPNYCFSFSFCWITYKICWADVYALNLVACCELRERS